MKNRLFRLSILMLVMILLLPVSVLAETSGDSAQEIPVEITVSGKELNQRAAEMFDLINKARADAGLPALNRNAVLTELASQRAAEVSCFFDTNDQRPDGTGSETILDSVYSGYSVFSEYVRMDHETPEFIMMSLLENKNDPAEIFHEEYTQIGIGCYNAYGGICWVFLYSDDSDSMESCSQNEDTYVPRKVSILPSRLALSVTPTMEFEFLQNAPQEFSIRHQNSGTALSFPELIPLLSDVTDENGNVIASLSFWEEDHAKIQVTPVAPGQGTAKIYAYEGHTEPFTLTVTVHEDTFSTKWGDNLTWNLEGSTLTISGEGPMAMEVYGSMYFPWSYHKDKITDIVIEEGVTSIAEGAFSWLQELRSVTLPNTMESIEYRAFANCTALSGIELPDSLTQMGADIFSGCSSLSSVKLPSGLSVIPYGTFSGTGLTTLELPDTVQEIGPRAYSGCRNLTSVTIPDSVVKLGDDCFNSCENLAEVKLPSGLKELPDNIFSSCKSLSEIQLPDGLEIINDHAFHLSGLVRIQIPASVKEIRSYAFMNCADLEQITFLGTGLELNDGVFMHCTSLKEIQLPPDLTVIPSNCFYGSGLERIELPENVTHVWHDAFRMCENLQEIIIHPAATNVIPDFIDDSPNAVIACWPMSQVHLMVLEHELPYRLLPEDPTTPLYPISVYANDGGNVALSSFVSPAYRYVLVQLQPDSAHQAASLFYYRGDGAPEELSVLQLSELEFLILMPPCELELEVTFLLKDMPFVDVNDQQYYYAPVLWALTEGITSGTDATHFSPDAPCTRAQVVTFLWRAAGKPEPTITDNPFVDVKPGDYFYDAVLWALETGITAGTDATHFSPDAGCTRAQVVTFLWRACGKPEVDTTGLYFVDVAEGQYYYDAVMWAAAYQITSGVNSTHFSPDTVCTRAQIVTFLFRTFY